MEVDISKLIRQYEGVKIATQNNYIGTLHYVWQFGKTNTARLIIEKIINSDAAANFCIVVPNIPLIDQWVSFLNDFPITANAIKAGKIKVYSANKIISGEVTEEFFLMIIDEIHRFTAPEWFKIIDGTYIKYNRIIGLTATFPANGEGEQISKYCPVIDVISRDEAISKHWISGIVEYNLKLDLSDEDKLKYEKYSTPISETLAKFRDLKRVFLDYDGKPIFNSDFALILSCFVGHVVKTGPYNKMEYVKGNNFRQSIARNKGWHPELDLNNELNRKTDILWNPSSLEIEAKKFKYFIERRQDLLINNSIKLEKVVELFDKFPVPTLCFNESVDFADRVAYKINHFSINAKLTLNTAVSYHSKLKSRPMIDPETNDYFRYKTGPEAGKPKPIGVDTIKNMIMEDIKNGEILFISTVRSLKEGISIPVLRMIITTAGDANPVTYLQKVGRGATIDPSDDGKVTRIINLYFDDFVLGDRTIKSRDKQKLVERQKASDNSIEWIENINDIM
jgi:superfamily II DNA or RNA helicase